MVQQLGGHADIFLPTGTIYIFYLIQFAGYDIKTGLTPLLPAGAIALLTVAVNFVVDWFLQKTSGLRE